VTVVARHRQRAQITPFALFAALILTGAVAMVVDAGVFFVTQRQIQTATDAAALAAAWKVDNVCPFPGCDSNVPPGCTGRHAADCEADIFAYANLGYTAKLCSSVNLLPDANRRPLPNPVLPSGLRYYEMEISCDAPYWFARVFPGIPATMKISAKAIATVGYRDANGNASGTPSAGPLIGRLYQ
jgi:hypothetical protein